MASDALHDTSSGGAAGIVEPQEAVCEALRDAEHELRAMMAARTPSARDRWRKLQAVRRRLRSDPPAGKRETVQRLQVIRDEWVKVE